MRGGTGVRGGIGVRVFGVGGTGGLGGNAGVPNGSLPKSAAGGAKDGSPALGRG